MLTKRSVLLAKTESSYNNDASPAANSDAVAVENLQISWPTEVIDRNLIDPSLSPHAPVHGRKYGQLTFDVELKGSGTAGTAANWGALLLGCGFDETIVPATSVTYGPVSSSLDSLTIYAYRDGVLYKFTGCRGNVQFRFPAGQRAMMSFTFMGHCVDVADASLVSPTLDSTKPVPVKNSSFTINSYAAVISALNLDMQNNVVIPDSVNATDGYGEVRITGRNAQGSLDPEMVLVATHDFWSEWEDGTEMALSIAVTGNAGNIATFTAPKVVYREFNEGERDGIYTLELPFTAARNSGDDEVSLAMT